MCAEQEIRKCGDGWAYCNGSCEECYKNYKDYSNSTDGDGEYGH